MPSLLLLAYSTYRSGVKRELARRLGDTYAEVMDTEPETITVAIPDMGADGVWRCGQAGAGLTIHTGRHKPDYRAWRTRC